jgi:hypothetical protein
MATLTNEEVKNVLNDHHTGLVILMPGNPDNCPVGGMIVGAQVQFQFGMNGCYRCMMYAIRGIMEKEPALKKLVIDALATNYNP